MIVLLGLGWFNWWQLLRLRREVAEDLRHWHEEEMKKAKDTVKTWMDDLKKQEDEFRKLMDHGRQKFLAPWTNLGKVWKASTVRWKRK